MKRIAAFTLSLLLAASAAAQSLRPELVNGAVLGGIAGAVIGNNSGDLRHNAWRGAALGAGAGLLLGAMTADANDRVYAHQPSVPFYRRPVPVVYGGGYYRPSVAYWHGGGRRHHGYYHGHRHSGVYVSVPSYYASTAYYDGGCYDRGYASYGNTSYAGAGTILGGIAGAIIGHNSGDLRHNGWRGAAIGAAAGYVLGSIADRNVRARAAAAESSEANDTATQTVADAPLAPAAPLAPLAPAVPATSMASANRMFGR